MHTRVFVDTPEYAAKTHPFIGAPLYPEHGAVLGIELGTGRVVFLDPAILQREGQIHSPVIYVFGQKFAGKSSWLKSILCRMPAIQIGADEHGVPYDFRCRAHGVKPANDKPSEYDVITEHFHGRSFAIENASLNLCDPKMNLTTSDMIESIVGACEMLAGVSPLPASVITAIQIAINKMMSTDRMRAAASQYVVAHILGTITKADYDHHVWESSKQFWQHDPELAYDLGIPHDKPAVTNMPDSEIEVGAARAAALLWQLKEGVYGRIFGGEKSFYDVLSEYFLQIMWGTTNDKARALAEAEIMRWMKRALIEGHRELIPNLDVSDELHGAVNIKTYMRAQNAWHKEIRAYPTILARASQYETDVSDAGEADSEIRALAESIMMGTGIRVLGLQPNNPKLEALYLRFGMSKQQVKLLGRLETGCFAILIENRPTVFYQHILTPTEYKLVDTKGANRQMTTRMPVMSPEAIKWLVGKNGYVVVGADDEAEVAP